MTLGLDGMEEAGLVRFDDLAVHLGSSQFLYTAPDAVLREIPGLPPRQPLPFYRLIPLTKELRLVKSH